MLVPSLPGCISHGRTVDEAAAMAKEAIALHLENLKAHRFGGDAPDESCESARRAISRQRGRSDSPAVSQRPNE